MSVAACTITGSAIPPLFISIRAGKRTGTAVFEYLHGQTAEKAVKKVYCRGGDVIFAGSNLPDDWLGRHMTRAGMLTPEQCKASEELIVKTGKKQGVILMELGYITPPKLVDAVKLQVREIILSLFSIRTGSFRFDEGPLPAADIIPLQLSIGNIILQGLRQLDWQLARKALPAPSTILNLSSDPSVLFQQADLTPDETAVLALIDGRRSIEEICSASGIGDFNALRALHLLLALTMAETGATKSDEAIRLAHEEVGRQAAAAAHDAGSPEIASRGDIVRAHGDLARMDHYQVLGLPRTADDHGIKKAYFHMAKLYHPDRHFEPDMQDAKPMLEALFERVHEAYEILSNADRRREYDQGSGGHAAEGFEALRPEDYVENYAEKAARAVPYFNAGVKDYKAGNFWGAAESFAWAARLDPVKSLYFFYHGMSLSRIPRRLHEAEENIRKAIEIDPLKADYYVELGKLYLKSGLKAKALEVYRVALEHNPDSAKILSAIKEAGG